MVNTPSWPQAARSIATPQIRSVGTLGGNLCQRPRCWYYRHPDFPCYKKGGVHCYGANGYNRNLAILGGGASVMVHPSDMAPALIAMNARLEAYGPQGTSDHGAAGLLRRAERTADAGARSSGGARL